MRNVEVTRLPLDVWRFDVKRAALSYSSYAAGHANGIIPSVDIIKIAQPTVIFQLRLFTLCWSSPAVLPLSCAFLISPTSRQDLSSAGEATRMLGALIAYDHEDCYRQK